MASEWLVAPSGALALEAAKRIEFNFLKAYIQRLQDKSIVPKLRDALEDRDIDPRDLTLEQLYTLMGRIKMYGFKRGILNTTDGFTDRWLPETVIRRATDNAICLPIPEAGAKRDFLLQNIPNAATYIEEEQPDWFPGDSE